LRKVKAGDDGLGVRLAQKEARIAPVAAAGVEDAFAAAHVERPGRISLPASASCPVMKPVTAVSAPGKPS